jgi:beta-lactamase regulating signal transducer with metallopeptidase domain
MSALLFNSVLFSLVAWIIVRIVGRRSGEWPAGLLRLALAILLLYPLLRWLPKWQVLPAAETIGVPATAGGGWAWWATLWLIGVTVQAARLGISLYRLRAWRMTAKPLADADSLALARQCAAAIGLRREVSLLICPPLRGAAACGVWRPVVLLPSAWNRWSDETRRAVLLHELGHHASRDPLWRLLALIAVGVYWFNPLVWWLAARLQSQAEFACDARVVGCGFRADRYAHILCDLAGNAPSPAIGMAAPCSLEKRVRMLHSARGSVAPLVLAIAVVGLAIGALGLTVLRARKPIIPTPPAPVYSPQEVEARRSADPFPADAP